MLNIEVIVETQTMRVFENERVIREYSVSTGKNGVGELRDSEKTPRGTHIIRAKIGGGEPANTVFVGRRKTGEIYTPALKEKFPQRDWILTRIMWLSGVEVGKNRLHNVDTMRRFIYIHGTPDEVEIGKPGSKGCVRMRNKDIMDLYDLVPVSTPVIIR